MSRRDQSPDINEQSPLIGPERRSEDDDIEDQALSDDFDLSEPIVEQKSTLYFILLTLSLGGLQIVWSVELAAGTPYLASLGMSKALIAFVWVAGPVTGVLVQPYIGILSDRSRLSWGKRKPFMVGGALGTVGASFLLAYAKDIMRIFGGMSSDAKYEGTWQIATIVWATILMWVLDFSINTVQAAIRAFIADGATSSQQETANAWASRIVGVGNVTGYIFGFLNLPRYFHFFGNTQFKVLVTIASIVLSSTVGISVLSVNERNPQLDPPTRDNERLGFISFFKEVFSSIVRLPPQIRKVCEIQFFLWMGLFPFLFYITTYIGQLYVNPRLNSDLSDSEIDALWAEATRVATLALLIYAIVSFSSNVLLPFLIVPSYEGPREDVVRTNSPIGTRRRSQSYSDLAPSTTGGSQSNSLLGLNSHASHIPDTSPPTILRKCLESIRVPGLTLRRAWLGGQLLFSICMCSTFFITSFKVATVMVAIVGMSWALTLWAPFALISAEIAAQEEAKRRKSRQKQLSGMTNDEVNGPEDEEDQAGIILGLHNVAVSAPQVVATMICSIIFKFLQRPRNVPGDTSVAWTLRFGGLVTLIAAWITWRMQEPRAAVGKTSLAGRH